MDFAEKLDLFDDDCNIEGFALDTRIKINVRFEGGLGDCICAARFLPAIKEKHPHSKIKVFLDTQGNTFQLEMMESCYRHLYDEIEVIKSKKYKEFWVDCQFGTDNYYGAIENVPDDVMKRMRDCNKFYDLHIDSLKWCNYDFDWQRYFYFFAKPDLKRILSNSYGDYVVLHLAATSRSHDLQQFYIDGLVKKLSEFIKVVIICTPDKNKLFSHLSNDSVRILNGSISGIVGAINQAKYMIAIDSGFKYLAYGLGVPCITLSKMCQTPGIVPRHQEIRWLMFKDTVFPLNYNYNYIANVVRNSLTNRGVSLYPTVDNFDLNMVNRKYTINKEKTR